MNHDDQQLVSDPGGVPLGFIPRAHAEGLRAATSLIVNSNDADEVHRILDSERHRLDTDSCIAATRAMTTAFNRLATNLDHIAPGFRVASIAELQHTADTALGDTSPRPDHPAE